MFKYVVAQADPANQRDAVRVYFSEGRNSAVKLGEILNSDLGIAPGTPLSLLEFASGYGRVTRHLPKVLPNVSIVASDIHPEANEFVRQKIGVKSIQSASVPEEFPKTSCYDVVFVLSFFTHIPKKTWARWLKVLSDQLNVNGHLVFTTHGTTTMRKYMPDAQFDQDGFYFSEASEQDDLNRAEYGTTLTTPSFVIRAAELLDDCQARLFRGGLWGRHQDLWVIQKIPNDLVPLRVQTESIPSGHETIGNIDTCSLIAHGGINRTRAILRVEGWAAPAPSARSVADEVVIIIDSDDGHRYVAATDPCNRPDVSKAYSNPALLRSGFKTRIDMQGFRFPGTVKVAMRYFGQWVICQSISPSIVGEPRSTD